MADRIEKTDGHIPGACPNRRFSLLQPLEKLGRMNIFGFFYNSRIALRNLKKWYMIIL